MMAPAVACDRLPADRSCGDRMKDYDVAVVGGGISGCATAWFLATEGARVALLEQHDIITQASGRNAGSLHGQIQFSPLVERGEG